MSIRLPVDASQNVQAAFRDVEQELEDLKAVVASLSGGTDLTAVHERIDKIQPPPQLNSDEHTFVGAGSQHSVGLVPDPGTSGGDISRVLGESGGWVYQNVGKLSAADQNSRGTDDIYQVPGSLHVAGSVHAGQYSGVSESPLLVLSTGAGSGLDPIEPDAVSGLTGWYKADTEGLADGTAVSTFTDRSGASRDFTGSGGARPLYKTAIVNGLPVLRFDGTDDVMGTAAALSAFIANSAGTMFVVAKPTPVETAASSSPHLMDAMLCDSGSFVEMAFGASAERYVASSYTAGYKTAIKTQTISGSFHSFCWMHSSGTVYAGVDDARSSSMASTSGGNTDTMTGTLRIGANYSAGSVFSAVDIAEIIIYDNAVSEANRQGIEAYLAVKYALTLGYSTSTYGVGDLFRINDDLGREAFRIDKNGLVFVRGSSIPAL